MVYLSISNDVNHSVKEVKTMAQKKYVVTTEKGKITLPVALRKKWADGSKLILKVSDDAKNEVTISKKKNLYETSFGDYDFQKALHSDPELSLPDPVGKEAWGFEDEQ